VELAKVLKMLPIAVTPEGTITSKEDWLWSGCQLSDTSGRENIYNNAAVIGFQEQRNRRQV
jgi:hypothetical protein